jgi:Carboxypeptidase regulatory-like domain
MKRKKRSGISLALTLSPILLVAVLPPDAPAAKKKPAPAAYGLVAGTVFQPSGYALPDADVVLLPEPQANGPRVKLKKLETVSDARGEFVFRVPAENMRYTVKVSAKGYQAQQKSVTVEGEGRVDVTFQLEPESK